MRVAELLGGSPITVIAGAGHYVFLAPCSRALAERAREICIDAPGTDRKWGHAKLNPEVVAFLQDKLAARP